MKNYSSDGLRGAYIAAVFVTTLGMGTLLYDLNDAKHAKTDEKAKNNIEAILTEEIKVRRIDNGTVLRRRNPDYT